MFRELSIVDALPKLIVLRRSRLRWEQHVQSMSTMFYAFEKIHWRWCRHNTVPLSHFLSVDKLHYVYTV